MRNFKLYGFTGCCVKGKEPHESNAFINKIRMKVAIIKNSVKTKMVIFNRKKNDRTKNFEK